MCVLGERLAAVCLDAVSSSLVRWLERKGVEIVPVSLDDAFGLGVNGVCLGDDRVLSTAASEALNERLRALGISVLDPDLSSFTLGGGGAHCLLQALRRERVA
jgi:N-dimethylarginine dimethylaminohydrolase